MKRFKKVLNKTGRWLSARFDFLSAKQKIIALLMAGLLVIGGFGLSIAYINGWVGMFAETTGTITNQAEVSYTDSQGVARTEQSNIVAIQIDTTDTTAPVRTNGLPSGTLAAGTTSTTMSLTTNENATCKYATTAGVTYASMPNTFATTGSTSHSHSLTGLVNGTSYNYYIRCQDAAGNANSDDFGISFSVAQGDVTAPSVSLTAPANGATVSGSVTVSADASDNVGVTKVEFYRDSTTLIGTDTTTPYSISWNTTTVTNGSHTLLAKAYDANNNIGTSTTRTVTVNNDVTAPVRSNLAPSGMLAAGTTSTTISLSTNENATCKYATADNIAYSLMPYTFNITGGINHSSPINGLSNGANYNYRVRCQDEAGNANTNDNSISFSIDAIPTTSITSPTNGATVSGSISINATAADNVSVARVEFYYDNTNLIGTDTTSPYSMAWNTATVTNGSHNLLAKAYDANNNVGTSTAVAVTVNNITDFTPPIISNGQPTGTLAAGTTTTTISVHTSEAATCKYGATSNVVYSSMPYLMSTFDTLNHSATVSGLINGSTYHYYVRCRDTIGNVNTIDYAAITFSIANPGDSTPPTGTISINGDAAYSNNNVVTLTLNAQDNADGSGMGMMQFSNANTNDPLYWSSWQTYAASYAWDMVNGYGGTGYEGVKPVYVKFKDNAGNVSAIYTDTILYDKIAPTGSLTINNNTAYSTNKLVALNITATDTTSGVDLMRISNNNVSWSDWIDYQLSLPNWDLTAVGTGGNANEGQKSVYIQIKDRASNTLAGVSDSIIYDASAPGGTISINNNAQFTTSTQVTLNLNASDATSGIQSMHFTNNNQIWSPWQNYQTSSSWDLSNSQYGGTSSEGKKAVYVEYKDMAGNISPVLPYVITYDKTAPAGTIKINNGELVTSLAEVNVSVNATDNLAQIARARFSNDGGTWSQWLKYSPEATSYAWNMTSLNINEGTKKVYGQLLDNAGNISGVLSDWIIYNPRRVSKVISVNKFHPNAYGRDTLHLRDEYVIFKNNLTGPVVIDGWSIKNRRGKKFTINKYTLRGGARVYIHSGRAKNRSGHIYMRRWTEFWRNRSERIYLWTNEGQLALKKVY